MIEFTLPTMTCGHCVRAVTQAVKALDAEAEIQIDLPHHQVRIESKAPAERLRAALALEGYEPA